MGPVGTKLTLTRARAQEKQQGGLCQFTLVFRPPREILQLKCQPLPPPHPQNHCAEVRNCLQEKRSPLTPRVGILNSEASEEKYPVGPITLCLGQIKQVSRETALLAWPRAEHASTTPRWPAPQSLKQPDCREG